MAPHIDSAAVLSIVLGLAFFVAFLCPRGRVRQPYELFVAAPPQAVWDTYFVHIKKADYRPGTRVLDAEILRQVPLTVRLTLQSDISSRPTRVVLVYDVWQPYSVYRLHDTGGRLVEEGQFVPESGGTRLHIAITARMQGFLLPLLARRRVERNQQALKAVCEGRPPPIPHGALPQPGPAEHVAVLLLVGAVFLPVPASVRLALAAAGLGLGALFLGKLRTLFRRL